MTFYLYPGGFLFLNNIITTKILVYHNLCIDTTPEVPNIVTPTTYNARHVTN